jgi:hypothetical protein
MIDRDSFVKGGLVAVLLLIALAAFDGFESPYFLKITGAVTSSATTNADGSISDEIKVGMTENYVVKGRSFDLTLDEIDVASGVFTIVDNDLGSSPKTIKLANGGSGTISSGIFLSVSSVEATAQQVEFTLTVSNKIPDIKVETASASISDDNKIIVTAMVENSGDRDVKDFSLHARFNNDKVQLITIVNLGSGEKKKYSIRIGQEIASCGTNEIEVIADMGNNNLEQNEDNNIATTTIFRQCDDSDSLVYPVTLDSGWNLVGINTLTDKESTTCVRSFIHSTVYAYHPKVVKSYGDGTDVIVQGTYGAYKLSKDLNTLDEGLTVPGTSALESNRYRELYPETLDQTRSVFIYNKRSPCTINSGIPLLTEDFEIPVAWNMLSVSPSWESRQLDNVFKDCKFSAVFTLSEDGWNRMTADDWFTSDDIGKGFWIKVTDKCTVESFASYLTQESTDQSETADNGETTETDEERAARIAKNLERIQ